MRGSNGSHAITNPSLFRGGGGHNYRTNLKRSVLFLFLIVSNFSIAQYPTSLLWRLKNCPVQQAPPPVIEEETLCEQFGNVQIHINVNNPDINPAITNITLASSVNWGAVNGVVSDKNIRINDVLYVDIPLQFSNCKFIMGPGAIIRTSEGDPPLGNYFAATTCDFFCCDFMWKGFEIKDGAIVQLVGCKVEDAQIALHVDDDAGPVFLGGNRFNRNHIGIRNGTFQAGGDGTLNFGIILANTFECTSETNEPYGGTTGDNWTFAQIVLDRCASSIISWDGYPNIFRHSTYGIYLEDADLAVQHALFKDLRYIGIYTEYFGDEYNGSHVVVKDCDFDNDNIESAVYGLQSDVEVANCEIEGSYIFGVYSDVNHASEEVKINDNIFRYPPQTINFEVFVERPIATGSGGKHTEINDNQFFWEGLSSATGNFDETTCITLYSEQNAHVSDEAEISGNTFTLDAPDESGDPHGLVHVAIDVNTPAEFDNTKVLGNTITVADALMDYAIRFNDQFGTGSEISHNTVAEDLETVLGFLTTFYGISVLNATSGVTMCDNTLDGTQYGVRFWANNGMSDFRNNNFGEHGTGLFIEDYLEGSTFVPGEIGDQIGHGNTWLTAAGSYLDKAGRCQSNILSSEFIIENAFPSPSAQFPATNLLSPSLDWFKNFDVPSDWCIPSPPPSYDPRLSDGDLEVADETGDFSSRSQVSKWEARRLLLDKLLRYPTLISENTTVSAFYNNWLNASPGLFAQIENQIREAYAIHPDDQADTDDFKAERRSRHEQLLALEAGIEEPWDIFNHDPELLAEKETLFAELFQLHNDEAALKAQIRQKQEDALQTALVAVDQLPASEPYEANRQLFYRLGIRLFLNGTLEESEEIQLQNLTASGQTNGGLAVEDAKILLPICGSGTALRDQGQQRIGKRVTANPENTMIIAPNPASGPVIVNLDAPQPGQITLTDMTGKIRLEQSVSSGQRQITLNVDILPAGVYFITYRADAGHRITRKFVVQH